MRDGVRAEGEREVGCRRQRRQARAPVIEGAKKERRVLEGG
jgi:hypothetical protein